MMAWDEGQTLDARWEHAREMARGLRAHWTRVGLWLLGLMTVKHFAAKKMDPLKQLREKTSIAA
jgi:hypothetical protein